MATRFYFHAGTSSISNLPTAEQSSLSASGGNAEGSQTTNRKMTTSIGSGQTSLSINSISDSSRNYYYTRFVSDLLNVSSLTAQTWTYNFAAKQNGTQGRGNFPVSSNDKPVWINIYVWRPGTGKIGTVLDGNTASTVDEASDGVEKAHHVTLTGSSVGSMQNGDVLIVEIWFVVDPLTGGSGTPMLFYYDGTTVNTTDNATVSNHASFLETPQNITFGSPNIVMTNTAAKTYANHFITKV